MDQDNKDVTQKDLITSEDVATVVNGNEQALIEQLERARQVALEQLEASKNAQSNGVTTKSKEQLEKEVAEREAQLKAALANAGLNESNKNKNINLNDAKDTSKAAQRVEDDIKSRAKPIDTTRVLSQSNVEVSTGTVENTNAKIKPSKIQKTTTPAQNPNQKKLKKKQLKEQKRLEKQKKKEEKRANSNFKYIMTIILFIGLFALVYFLPEISNYMAELKKAKELEKNAIITTGNLECKLKTYNDKFDYEYYSIFAFTDSKLIKYTYKATTKGDAKTDQEELNSLKEKCDILKKQTKSLDGIVVKCSLSNGVNKNEQVLNYENINVDKVTTSYLEAGGTYPNYKYQQNINKIEKEMKAAGYTCERTK